MEWWNCGSRLKTRERENESIDADLLVVAASCQRSPKMELSAETSKSRVMGRMKWDCWQGEVC